MGTNSSMNMSEQGAQARQLNAFDKGNDALRAEEHAHRGRHP